MPVDSVRRLLAAGLAVSLATVAQPTNAQTRSWDNYCTTGSLNFCFSIDISVALVPNPGLLGGFNALFGANPAMFPFVDSVTVRFRNLEGTLGSAQAWGLESIHVDFFGTDNPVDLGGDDLRARPTLEGNAQFVGVPPQNFQGIWNAFGPKGEIAGFDRSFQVGDGGFPIAGCTPLPPDGNSALFHFETGYFSTCGNSDIAYTFFFVPVSINDSISTSMTGYVANGSASPTSQLFGCALGVNCIQVTPEPSTLALLGTGVIGLAFWLPRRSRRVGRRLRRWG